MENTTRSAESLAKNLEIAQEGLRNVWTILKALDSRRDDLWYEIGRAQGTAQTALTMSGGAR